MRYEITDFPRKEFDLLDRIVRATVVTSRLGSKRPIPRLQLVTDNRKSLPRHMQKEADPDKVYGLTFPTVTSYGPSSTIWVDSTPMPLGIPPLEVTLLHELAHAYALDMNGYSSCHHGKAWRTVFGMSLVYWAYVNYQDPGGLVDTYALPHYNPRTRTPEEWLEKTDMEYRRILDGATRKLTKVKELLYV